jgi:hypothetical protein
VRVLFKVRTFLFFSLKRILEAPPFSQPEQLSTCYRLQPNCMLAITGSRLFLQCLEIPAMACFREVCIGPPFQKMALQKMCFCCRFADYVTKRNGQNTDSLHFLKFSMKICITEKSTGMLRSTSIHNMLLQHYICTYVGSRWPIQTMTSFLLRCTWSQHYNRELQRQLSRNLQRHK